MQYNKRDAVAVYSNNEEGTCDELVIDFYNRKFEHIRIFENCVRSGHAAPDRFGELEGAHYEMRSLIPVTR